MDCYNFSKGSFYFNLFQDFNKFFREMYTSEDSNALFSQYSEKFIQFYPGDFSFDLLFALGRVTEQKHGRQLAWNSMLTFLRNIMFYSGTCLDGYSRATNPVNRFVRWHMMAWKLCGRSIVESKQKNGNLA